MTREKETERHFVKQVQKAGGIAFKWVSPGNSGVPDRIVLLPGEIVAFVELKTKRGELRTQQIIQRTRITGRGFLHFVINCKEDVDIILAELGF